MRETGSSRFNSTLVQLKGLSSVDFLTTSPVFQFHIGSIKSRSAFHLNRICLTFQFHIGSIKSLRFCRCR